MTEEKEPKRKNRRYNSMMNSYIFHPIRYKIFRFLRWAIGIIICGGLVFLLLSGAINQVKTGENMLSYFMNIGHHIGDGLESLFTDDSPLKANEDGVYFKDASVPDKGALNNIADNDSNSDDKNKDDEQEVTEATNSDKKENE